MIPLGSTEHVRAKFRGFYVDPARFILPEFSMIRRESGKLPGEARNLQAEVVGMRSNRIGTYEKKGENDYRLKIYLAFMSPGRFICRKNTNAENANAPDMRIFLGPIDVGGLWTKKTDDGKVYKSGTILAPHLPGKKLSFAIFKGEDENSSVHNVVASFDERAASGPPVTPEEDF